MTVGLDFAIQRSRPRGGHLGAVLSLVLAAAALLCVGPLLQLQARRWRELLALTGFGGDDSGRLLSWLEQIIRLSPGQLSVASGLMMAVGASFVGSIALVTTMRALRPVAQAPVRADGVGWAITPSRNRGWAVATAGWLVFAPVLVVAHHGAAVVAEVEAVSDGEVTPGALLLASPGAPENRFVRARASWSATALLVMPALLLSFAWLQVSGVMTRIRAAMR
jgi:hypothetical protein